MENNNFAVTIDEIKEQGFRLTEIMTRLDMVKGYSALLQLAEQGENDYGILKKCRQDFISQINDEMGILYKEIDNIASILLLCNDPKELKAYKECKE